VALRTPWEVLIDWLVQMDPSRREILLAGLALLVLFAVGPVGYVLLEDWTLIEGVYMAFLPLSASGSKGSIPSRMPGISLRSASATQK